MNLDSYSIQELESIDFRSSLGKKIKCEMGISTKEIKKRINEIILKKKSVKIENEKSDYFDMINLLPNQKINIRESNFKLFEKNDINLKESISDNNIENIDLTKDESNDSIGNFDFTKDDSSDYVDNIDFTLDDDKDENVNCMNEKINFLNEKDLNVKTVDTETNSVNYIVQLFNSDETVQLKLSREQFINFAINNGYSQEFILQFLNQGNKNNVCKIDEYQWLNDDFLEKLRIVLREIPLFFDSELILENKKDLDELYDKMYQVILDDIEENKRRSIDEMNEMNNEQLETLKNQYNTINTIEERLKNRFVEHRERDILKECDLFREDKFSDMNSDLDKIEDLRIRGFVIHYRYNCIHNKQRDVIDKIVRILIPPPKGFKSC